MVCTVFLFKLDDHEVLGLTTEEIHFHAVNNYYGIIHVQCLTLRCLFQRAVVLPVGHTPQLGPAGGAWL